jgi:hypothetical protein
VGATIELGALKILRNFVVCDEAVKHFDFPFCGVAIMSYDLVAHCSMRHIGIDECFVSIAKDLKKRLPIRWSCISTIITSTVSIIPLLTCRLSMSNVIAMGAVPDEVGPIGAFLLAWMKGWVWASR